MKGRVLITGGAGFLGVHTARIFLKEGWEVVIYDIAPLTAKDLIGKVTYIKGDVRNYKSIDRALSGITHIVHAAAALPIQRSKRVIYSTNVEGTKKVIQAAIAHRIKRFIFISSTAVYGVPRSLPETETTSLHPLGHYGKSKVAAEAICIEHMQNDLDITIFRPKTFLGPERLGVFALWFEAIYTGHRVFILGKGKNKYQLLAVSDVVDAIYKAMTSPITNEIFNLGAKDYQTWRKDLRFVIKTDKSHSRISSLPVLPTQIILGLLERLKLSPLSAWHYKTMPVASFVSIDKATKLLKWQPAKSNQDLLLENYLWYKQHRNKIQKTVGDTHRVNWNFKLLKLISHL